MNKTTTYSLKRHHHTVGRDNTKYHLVADGADVSACGRSADDFNCTLSSEYVARVIDGPAVCGHCQDQLAAVLPRIARGERLLV